MVFIFKFPKYNIYLLLVLLSIVEDHQLIRNQQKFISFSEWEMQSHHLKISILS